MEKCNLSATIASKPLFTQSITNIFSLPNNSCPIRVVVCAYPGIFADTVIQSLKRDADIDLVGLVYSQRIFSIRESWIGGALRLLRTAGIGYAVLQFLQTDFYLLLRQVMRRELTEVGIPVLRTKNINSEEGLKFLADLKPDILLAANFNQKIHPPIIALPAIASINIHPSLLPDYKGVDPVFAALFAEEKTLGVSIHKIDEDFDTGAILRQTEMSADPVKSVFYHQYKLFQSGALLAVDVINNFRNAVNPVRENSGGHYDSWPSSAQVNVFTGRGGKLITWRDYFDAVRQTVFTV